jgi:hypothetical protein
MSTIPRIYAPPSGQSATPASAPGPTPPAATPTAAQTKAADPPWFAKLMLMFPAEAVTAYTAGVQYFSGGKVWIALVTLIALLIVRWFALKPADGGPVNYLALVVSGISFLLWVGSTADVHLVKDMAEYRFVIDPDAEEARKALQRYAAFFILIWTWVMPSVLQLNPKAVSNSG